MVDLDFEWFDPQPEHDYHGLKTLLRQLLDDDAQLFELGALADLILSQPLLGSTVKLDGNETDPYAFLTVLNLREHRVHHIGSRLVFEIYISDLEKRSILLFGSWLSIWSDELRQIRFSRRLSSS